MQPKIKKIQPGTDKKSKKDELCKNISGRQNGGQKRVKERKCGKVYQKKS